MKKDTMMRNRAVFFRGNGMHMELKKMMAPFDAEEALQHLEKIFGIEERLLEECQLNGSEAQWNQDIVYFAYEDKTLLGMIHATIPLKTPNVAGLSAMLTTEPARGKGIGKLLFGTIVEELSQRNVRLTVLGTSNPIAAKLYSKFGFGFYPGSNIMTRFSQGNMVDFTEDCYSKMCGTVEILRGTPAMRIPIVPLVLQSYDDLILDINTEIFNANTITQRSCMGLFPRYVALRKRGGEYFMAMDAAGTLGAVGSVSPMENGSFRADFFSLHSFAAVLPAMIDRMEETFGNVYFEIACGDKYKKQILEDNGFCCVDEDTCTAGELMIKTVKYSR